MNNSLQCTLHVYLTFPVLVFHVGPSLGAINHTNRTFYKNIFRSINRSLHPMGGIPQIILRLWGFFFLQGCRTQR